MKSIKVMLLGLAIILFGSPFIHFGGEGVLITLFLIIVGLFVCMCGFVLDDAGDTGKGPQD